MINSSKIFVIRNTLIIQLLIISITLILSHFLSDYYYNTLENINFFINIIRIKYLIYLMSYQLPFLNFQP